MGCGASKDPKVAVADSHRPVQNPNNRSNQKNGFRQVELKNNSQSNPVNEPKKAPLAFVISFDENNKNGNATRPPPGRLRLEPIKHNSQMTKADIDDKMRSAEIKRERILAERAKSSSGKKFNQSFNQSQRPAYNDRRESEDNENRQRLLNRRRIIQTEPDDDEIEHDRNYNRESDDFDRRY